MQHSASSYYDDTLPAARIAPGILPKRRQQRKVQARTNARTPVGGRYTPDAGNAIVPGNGLAPARSHHQDVTVAAVQDPYDPRAKLAVSVNRRVDYLEYEHSHGRLTTAAYLTGRELQGLFERASGRSACNWSMGDRVDAYASKELQIIGGIEKARAIKARMDAVTRAVGQVGARFLRLILSDGKTYAELAAMRGQSGEAGKAAAASRFRHLLEDLAEELAAEGARA